MNDAAPKTIVVDVDAVANKILKDPRGLSGVAATDLVALASYVLQSDQEPRLSPELAAAITAVLNRRDQLAPANALYAWIGPSETAFEDALNNLQIVFGTEFPE